MKKIIFMLCLFPSLAIADSAYLEQLPFILNSILFILGAVLVMWMGAGFAMLEAGMLRAGNVATQLTKNFTIFGVSTVMYYLIGYKLAYPGDAWLWEGVLGSLGLANLEPVGVLASEVDDLSYAATSTDFIFQLMFCATTASIVSGAMAERVKIIPFMIFTVFFAGVIYPIVASWTWGGGFLSEMGFKDFAGSTIVHGVGGVAALIGAFILGPRIGRYKNGQVVPFQASNIPLAVLGTYILWMGWFGFNGASQLSMSSTGDVADIGRIFANTNLAAASGLVAAFIITTLRYGKPDLTIILNGSLGGLVIITADPLMPTLTQAALFGVAGGALITFAIPLFDKLKIDDAVGAISVHMIAGIVGTLIVPITNPEAIFMVQLKGVVFISAFVAVMSLLMWLFLKYTIGIRVSSEAENLGIDYDEVGILAYPEFQK